MGRALDGFWTIVMIDTNGMFFSFWDGLTGYVTALWESALVGLV
jgi:hypothetical protein